MKRVLVTAVSFALAGLALADERVSETLSTSSTPTIDIEVESGRVQVQTWDRNEVKLEGTIDADMEDFEFRTKGSDSVSLVIESDKGGRYGGWDNKQRHRYHADRAADQRGALRLG